MPRKMQRSPVVTREARYYLSGSLRVMEELRARPTIDPLFKEWLDKRMGEIEGMITVLDGIEKKKA